MSADAPPVLAGVRLPCPDCGKLHARHDDAALDALVREACIAVSPSTQSIYRRYRIAEPGGRWSTDAEAGLLRFAHADGSAAGARYQVVGSWFAADPSFVWGWALDQRTPATEGAARRTLEHGQRHGHAVLTSRVLRAEEEDSWHLANLTAHLAGLPAVFRAPVADGLWALFAFAEPEWERA